MKVSETISSSKSSSRIDRKVSPFFSKNSESNFFDGSFSNDRSFFTSNNIQPKLTIGQPDDKYEREADAVADKVVQRLAIPEQLTSNPGGIQTKSLASTITPLIQRKCAHCEEEEKLQKKNEEGEERDFSLPLQRKPIFESNEDSSLQMKCEECNNEEIQKKESGEEEKGVQEKGDQLNEIQRKLTLETNTNSVLQMKCAECDSAQEIQKKETEEEEKKVQEKADTLTDMHHKPIFEGEGEPTVQKKSGPVTDQNGATAEILPGTNKTITSDGNSASVIQTKCAACEQENEIQKKEEENGDHDITSVQTKSFAIPHSNKPGASVETGINSTKGRGNVLPKNVRNQMESSFGADFSNVRIHNDSHAAQMNKELHSQAFTHGSDIYFNEGKYDAKSSSGTRLLAHELTHTMQQGASTSNRQSVQATQKKIQTYPQVGEQLPSTDKQATYYSYRNDVVDIKGMGTFEPGRGLGNYIASLWENGQEAPVNIKFGSLAAGYIWVKQSGSYYSKECIYIPASLFWGVEVCRDTPPESSNYYAKPQVIPFEHPDIDTSERNGTLVLIVRIDSGVIWGMLGWIEGKTKDNIEPLLDAHLASTEPGKFYPLIFGVEHDGKKFEPNPSVQFTNILTDGFLKFFFSGDLNVDHQQKLSSNFILFNDFSIWTGKLKTDIQGAEEFELPIERTPQGYLSGESDGLSLNKSWKGEGFTVDAGLHISYVNANLFVTGTASYKSKRASGSITITISDQETAQQLFLKHLPVKQAEAPPAESFEDTALPDKEKPLALTAWGQFHLTLIDKLKKLEADAAFVVSPEGYVVTAGQVKLQKDFTLMDRLERTWKLAEIEENIRFWVWGAPVKLSARGELTAGYGIGDITFAEIIASGVYSTHPLYPSELCISGTVDMPADLWAKLAVTLAAAIDLGYGKYGFTLVEAGGTVTGKAELNAYVRAKPAIGIIKKQGENPDYCVGGKLYVGGQLQFGLSADFGFSVFKKVEVDGEEKEEKKGSKNLIDTKWTIGDFGVELAVEYILGSGEKPEFTYSGKAFDEAAFLRALWKGKSNKAKRDEAALKGGFEQEGEEKGTVQDKPFEPLHQPNEAVKPHAIIDSFTMNGKAHTLFLTIKGTQDAPEAKLEMQTEKEDLNAKIDDEILMLNSLLIMQTFNLSEKEEKKIRQAIQTLETIKSQGTKVKDSAKQLAAEGTPSEAGVEQLGDLISNYGERFDRDDLGTENVAPAPAPANGVKVPPPGVNVVLHLPRQKSIHLAVYQKYVAAGELYHSTTRAERDTEQITKWNDNMSERISPSVICLGNALGLYRTGQDDPGRNILRPFWTPKRLIGKNSIGEQMRMTVDHLIEYQLRPLSGGDWVDGPWNFELLEPSANSSSGSTLKSNIKSERERLATLTGDDSWLTDDIRFTSVVVDGVDKSTERYLEGDIESGKHLRDYKKLTGELEDKEALNKCKESGGLPI